VNITVLSGGDFWSNVTLHDEIIRLAGPTYEDASVVLSSALSSYDTVYLAYDDKGELVSFYMAAFEDISIGNRLVPSVHLGWTCSTVEAKGTGSAQLLYERFNRDGKKRQHTKGVQLLLWGTTATPIGFYLYHKHFADVLPHHDGAYPETAVEIAEALRERLKVTKKSEHPFVLKECHKGRFSQQELKRIDLFNQAKEFSLFRHLGIDERQGDRLLVTCRFPQR
jgi:hypothetical protein